MLIELHGFSKLDLDSLESDIQVIFRVHAPGWLNRNVIILPVKGSTPKNLSGKTVPLIKVYSKTESHFDLVLPLLRRTSVALNSILGIKMECIKSHTTFEL